MTVFPYSAVGYITSHTNLYGKSVDYENSNTSTAACQNSVRLFFCIQSFVACIHSEKPSQRYLSYKFRCAGSRKVLGRLNAGASLFSPRISFVKIGIDLFSKEYIYYIFQHYTQLQGSWFNGIIYPSH